MRSSIVRTSGGDGTNTSEDATRLDPAVPKTPEELAAEAVERARAQQAAVEEARSKMGPMGGGMGQATPAAPAAAYGPEAYALQAGIQSMSGPAVNWPQPPVTVLREEAKRWDPLLEAYVPASAGLATSRTAPPRYPRGLSPGPSTVAARSSTLDDYLAEYAEKILDPQFRAWIARRAWLDVNDPDLAAKAYSTWQRAGQMVGANPTLRGSMTPETWLDKEYELAGGDKQYDALVAAQQKEEEEPNPITTTTQTQTYRITGAQAKAIVDDLSQALLGRMASGDELQRARSAMQRLLTPTQTTTVTDATDPENVQVTTDTQAGVGPGDAADILRRRMQRSSEGMAFSAGKMFEQALARMTV